MTFDELVEKYKAKQKEIMDLEAEVKKIGSSLQAEIDKNTDQYLRPVEGNLRNAIEKYRAEMKADFGLADGEKTNVLDLALAIKKISGLQ